MGGTAMARRRKSNPPSEAIAKMIMEQYKPGSREEAEDVIKDVFGPIFEAMLQGEMESHLGYASNGHVDTATYRSFWISRARIPSGSP